MSEIKEKLWLQENFCRFFLPTRSNSQLITCPSCTHSNHSQGVKMKLWNISTASELLWGQGMLQAFFLANVCCPSPTSISKTCAEVLPYKSYLMLGNSLQWSCECHHSLKTMLQFTAASPSLQRQKLFPFRTWLGHRHNPLQGRIMDLGVHWQSHFGKAIP